MLEEKPIFFKKSCWYLYHFWTLSNFFCFGETFWKGLSKVSSKCPEEHFEEMFSLEKVHIFLSISDFEVTLLSHLSKYFRPVSQNSFLLVQRKNLEEKPFFNILGSVTILGIRSNFRTFSGNPSSEWSKLLSTCPEEKFEEKKFFSSLFRLLTIFGKFFQFSFESFWRFCQKGNLRVHKNFVKKNILF